MISVLTTVSTSPYSGSTHYHHLPCRDIENALTSYAAIE